MADNVWDLSKAIDSETTPMLNRSDSEPCIRTENTTSSDIAHPGGFRRHHMNENVSESQVSSHVKIQIKKKMYNVYIPFINSMLSQDNDEYGDGYELRDQIECLLRNQTDTKLVSADFFTEDSRLLSPGEDVGRNATLGHALLALLKAFVGTGILFLPHGFKDGGALFSPIVLAIVAYLTLYAMLVLLECKKKTGGTYGYVGAVAFGSWGHRMVQISIVLMQIGFCCTYIIFVATNMVDVLRYCGVDISVGMIILLQTLIYIPLSWVRYINYFAFSNLIADALILYGLAYILGNSCSTLVQQGPQTVQLFNSIDFPVFIGTSVFTFEGIGLVIPTQASLNARRQRKFKPLLIGTIGGLLLFYCMFASVNLFAYGDNIASIVTSNLPHTGWSISVQFGYSMAQLLSYPLFLFPAVSIIEETMWFPQRASGKRWQKNVIRSTTVMMTVLIAYYGQARLDLFVSIVGAFCCVPLSFIYPPLFHLKLFPKASASKRTMNIMVVAVGIATFLFVTAYVSTFPSKHTI